MKTSNSRDVIFAKIRTALDRKDMPSNDNRILFDRVSHPPISVKPQWHNSNVEYFISKAEKASASIIRIRLLDELPGQILKYLNRHRLKQEILMSDDTELTSLNWVDMKVHFGKHSGQYDVSLSTAYAGVAETGTLVLISSQQTPTSHNFLSDHHIVLLNLDDLVKYMEDVWVKLRKDRKNPRTINLVTGPSRTADIEQTIQLGAHGPKHLLVFLYDAAK